MNNINNESKRDISPHIKTILINNTSSKSRSKSGLLNNLSQSRSFGKSHSSLIENKSATVRSLLLKTNKLNHSVLFQKKHMNYSGSYSNGFSLRKKLQSVTHLCLIEEKRNVKYYMPLFNKVNEGKYLLNRINYQSYKAKQVYDLCRYDLQRMTRLMIKQKFND